MKRTTFWRLLALFAYRRWAALCPPDARKPHGVPGNRDPSHPCTAYAPRPRQAGDWGGCMTDGHYLCRECAHRAPPSILGEQQDGARDTDQPVRFCEREGLECYSLECRRECVAGLP